MTVSTTSTAVTQQGNGVTTVWNFSFIAAAAADLIVQVTVNGITTTLVPTQYSIFINPTNPGQLWGIGGTVTYPLSGTPLQAGSSITIDRAVPFTQTISISNQGSFYPQAIEQALDLLELQIQQLNTNYLYTMKFPLTDGVIPNTLPPASARANSALIFDSNGQPTVQGIPTYIPQPGQFAIPRRISTTGTATVNALITDSFAGLSIYQSSAPVTTIQLPVGFGPYPIFDASGNAGSFPITVLPPGGLLISGQASYTLAYNYQSAIFYNDGVSIVVA